MAADRRPVVVLAALREEAQDLARHLVQARIEGPGVRSWEGTLAGKPVVLNLTRVGKVAAAMAASSPATSTGRTLWCRSAWPAPPTAGAPAAG